METILNKLAYCVENGKINLTSSYPPALKGEPGVDELTLQALNEGIPPTLILSQGLVVGMERIGIRFRANEVYVPQVLMSARAMHTGMAHLKPYFSDGTVQRKGVFIMGTVEGDLHDIGKNLVCMMVEGNGFEVIDLGVDVSSDKFREAIRQHPDAFVGMSALLTTTMTNMEQINKAIKEEFSETVTFVGGAPVNDEFALRIGADHYTEEPQALVDILNTIVKKAS